MADSDDDEEILVLGLATDIVLRQRKMKRQRRRQERRYYVQPRNVSRAVDGFYGQFMLGSVIADDKFYKEHFRMSKSEFDDLWDLVREKLTHKPTHKLPISPRERLAITLKTMASGDCPQSVAFTFRIGDATARLIVYETCQVLWNVLQPMVLAMPTESQWREIAAEFLERTDFPLCLGAIDGKHIELQAPRNAGSAFFNYKQCHSIVLMAVADSKYRFVYADVGAYGRQSDGGVFGRSSFGRGLVHPTNPLDIPKMGQLPESGERFPFVFIGDAAFPIGQHLLKPYSGENLSCRQRVYNYRLSRARRVIEQTFGILSARWRIFRKPIEAEPEHADGITKAGVVLHNFLSMKREERNPVNVMERFGESMNDETDRSATRGVYLRDKLSDWFNSTSGRSRVPWQEDRARRGE